jgi:DNA-binding NarL/FixJ family response regulator
MRHILIVEDIAETRAWLSDIVASAFPNAQIQLEINVKTATRAIEKTAFDLALIDLGLPDGSGLDVLRKLKVGNPNTVCIITTIMGDNAHIVAALSAGAQGYLLKEQPAEILIKQLKQIADGIPALSPSIAQRIMEHFRFTGPAAESESKLTEREQEVLALIGRGLRNIDVADVLKLSENTVASHIKAIYRKLGISSRAEASWHATQMGLGNTRID